VTLKVSRNRFAPISVRHFIQLKSAILIPRRNPLKGFGVTKVMEIVDRFDTNTYRAIYTVQFADVIYVLHAFQKKSKSGIATPQKEIELIRRRLAEAQRLNRQRSN
jgi:phage-related protein